MTPKRVCCCFDFDAQAGLLGIDFWEGGYTGKKLALGTLYQTIMLENVSVDVVDCARVKGVLGVSVRPQWHGRGYYFSEAPFSSMPVSSVPVAVAGFSSVCMICMRRVQLSFEARTSYASLISPDS